MSAHRWACAFVCLALAAAVQAGGLKPDPVTPRDTVKLFNGKDLSGLTTWLRDTKRDDPRQVFAARDGLLHISGDGFGYVATDKEYRDYHLVVEYKWGRRTDGGKYVRNSGVLLHATGPDGSAGGTWMSSIECQLAQGCVGDLIVIRGQGREGRGDPRADHGRDGTRARTGSGHRWKKGGEVKTFPPSRGSSGGRSTTGTSRNSSTPAARTTSRARVGEWTQVECVCDGPSITVACQRHQVNECSDVVPAAGKILLQSEGFELFVRKFEIRPLRK